MAADREAPMTTFRTIDLSGGRAIRAAVEGQGPLVLMVHGFPESWFSWRHQLGPIAAAGFTACAIDVRGYGGSFKPHPVSAYAMEAMVGDVADLAEALSPGEKVVLIGHDWGAPIVWNTALVRPDRIRAVAGLSVPYLGVPKRSFRAFFDEVFTQRGKFFYQAYFQAEGVAEVELEGLVDPDPFPAWLTPADLDYYVGEFEASGFRGPLNRYRNHDADFAWLSQFEGRKIDQPALFIGGERDLVLSMLGRGDLTALMRAEVPNLAAADILPGCGHWTQQERPAEVNQRLLAWLTSL
jgi:pimeloyl-ACP methyl ester carboxylesterase